jgi:alkylglycerol monooxygenase
MESTLLVLAMPAFFVFLALEYYVLKAKKRTDVFKYESSVSNISIGVAERLLNLFIAVPFYKLFCYVYNEFALFHIPNNWLVGILLLMSADFVWYWYHRLGHEINFFWGAHIVHHQSEEFNYTVSARITTVQALIRNVFWCVLPFIGFHPDMVLVVLVVHGSYSFFTHTQAIGRIGWLENILITPSLHGVHHASNEKYLDKNYGDVFVFWDKMFGTFQTEEEKPVYGLTHPLQGYSFLWQHFHYYLEIIEACKRTEGLSNKLRIVFGSPARMDQDIRPLLEKRFLQQKLHSRPSKYKFRNYLNVQLAISVVLLSLFTYIFDDMSNWEKLFGVSFILVTLINCGALIEQRRWIYYLEYLRVFFVLCWLTYIAGSIDVMIFFGVVLVFLEYSLSLNKMYFQYVLNISEDQ